MSLVEDQLKINHEGSELIVDLWGAQIISWKTKNGGEQMYYSTLCKHPKDGASFRAGNPICFPQFGMNGPLTKHGFVRMQKWSLNEKSDNSVSLKLSVVNEINNGINHNFEAVFNCKIAADTLECELVIENTSIDKLEYTGAFHPYFSVGDVEECYIEGLKGSNVFDKTGLKPSSKYVETDDVVKLDKFSIDSCFSPPADSKTFTLNRGKNDTRGHVKMENVESFKDCVVWNIGEKECIGLKDMLPTDWKVYVCMECAILEKEYIEAKKSKNFRVKYTNTF